MSTYTPDQISKMIDGKLDWETTLRMLSMPKDKERFEMYLKALQEKVDFDDQIVLPLGPHLYIVSNAKTKKWETQCDCGHSFGDYRENWKLSALIYVRDNKDAMSEIYPDLMSPDTDWQVYREYYCPECGSMLDVEAPTPWYPILHDFEPDIEGFYQDWVGLPLPPRA